MSMWDVDIEGEIRKQIIRDIAAALPRIEREVFKDFFEAAERAESKRPNGEA